MQYPQLPVIAFLSALLVLIPIPSHWRARNVAILAIIFWLFFTNIIYGVNAIVWAGNVNDYIPIWCDITTKFTAGTSYALPLCTLCICKHLEMVSSSRKASYDINDRWRRMVFEGVVCFLIPLVFMALHYIVQGHRYDIIENIGCQAAVYISIPAVFIIWFPQLLFSVITFIYAALALHNFIRRRLTFAAHLQNSNSTLTTNRYLRLIAMAITEMFWGTVLTSYNLWSNVSSGLRPWTNWADVHSNFERVDAFPMLLIPEKYIRVMMLFWWSIPASSIIFFAFFGFGAETIKEYRKIWSWFKTAVLRKHDSEKTDSLFGGSMSKKRSVPRPLRLPNMKWVISRSCDSQAKSPTSITSRSTVTFATHSPGAWKITKLEESQGDRLPSYYESSSPTSSTQPTLICQYIDTKRKITNQLALPEIDESDAFTISSFSHYESSPFANARPRSVATEPTSGATFDTLAPPTPPHPPSPRFARLQHSLSPPPRKQPRAVGSLSSLLSTPTSMLSHTAVESRTRTQDVPEDVGASSPVGVSDILPERDALAGHAPLSTSDKVLGVQGGKILITVQRQASVDERF